MRETVTCSRCHKSVQGRNYMVGTCGFYDGLRPDSPWRKYMKESETVLCDPCMHSDPSYRADYPYASQWQEPHGEQTMEELWRNCWVPAFQAHSAAKYPNEQTYPFEELPEKAPILWDFLRRVAERVDRKGKK